MYVLVVIPARAGSKGLPGKNLRRVGDLSLVGRAAITGRRFLTEHGLDGAVLLDTDGEELAAEGRRFGAEVPFLRPPELAADATPTIDNVVVALARWEQHVGRVVDAVVLLQPTSPLRTAADVGACWRAFDAQRAPSVVSVVRQGHPLENALRIDDAGVLHWRADRVDANKRRQDHLPVWWLNGAVYITTAASLRERRAFVVPGLTRAVEMPPERSIDIDAAADLELADALARRADGGVIHVAGRAIGAGQPCFVIAEAGVNHNGDMALAHRLVDVAADAKADVVKFQTFEPARLVSHAAAQADYQVQNTGKRQSQRDMLAALVLPPSAHRELQAHANERGVMFLSSPFDEASADFLVELGVPALKIPSGEVTNHPLLAHVARLGVPLLVSTGMCEAWEVQAALEVIDGHGAPPVALFHCVTSYPAAADDVNLRAIDAMRAAFGRPVGYSDHTQGVAVSLGAVARGASLIEKHFTVDCALPGPDHRASLEPAELATLVTGIRTIERALGDGHKAPRPVELPLITAARKSVHAARPLAAGAVLSRDDLIALRPGSGIPAARLSSLLGRRTACALDAGQLLEERHLA